VPAWQSVPVGAQVRLAPEVAMTVAVAEPGHALVLRGGIPMGSVAAPFDCTWAFVLREEPDRTTRLVSRERYRNLRWWAGLIVAPTSVISFVMSRKMLRGIAERAEHCDGPRTTSTEGPADELGLEAYRPHTEQFGPLQRTGIWRPVPALLDGAGRKPGDEENLRPRATRMWCHS
jgi:hypothetical protein